FIPYSGEGGPSWTCPEQAQLVQSCLNDMHVLGIIPTGSGKTLAIFAAACLYPDQLFLVIVPLTALVNDLMRRLAGTSIISAVFKDRDGMAHVDINAQIVIVPSHLVARDAFLNWSRACADRLHRIFMDESHLIYLSDYREEFASLSNLTSLAKPFTFLSATIFPRSIKLLCESMKISPSLLHIIRSRRPRSNIEYNVERLGGYIEIEAAIKSLLATIHLGPDERGLIYCKTVGLVKNLASTLSLPCYYSKMDSDAEKNNAIKDKRHQTWRNGHTVEQRWMVATMGFGQGIDYGSVRYVIHCEVHGLVHFVQEVGRAGRDGQLARSYVYYSEDPGFRDANNSILEDHSGKAEMKRFLTTTGCRRLEFYALDGVANSCASLPRGSPMCDNCRKLASEKDPSTLRTMARPEFHRPMISDPSESGSKRVPRDIITESIERGEKRPRVTPLTVENHGELLHRQLTDAENEMKFLKRIVDLIVTRRCPYCWVNQLSAEDHKHQEHATHKLLLTNLRNSTIHHFPIWPSCYHCWLPFRSVFNHPSWEASRPADHQKCPHDDVIEYLLPNVIAHIWSRIQKDGGKDRMERRMEITSWKITVAKNFQEFGKWLKTPPLSRDQVPNTVKLVNAFYREFIEKKM
ncbi:hypothetical protein H0H93_008033, partial [Arthromyces matolae]